VSRVTNSLVAFLATVCACPCLAADVTWMVYSAPFTFIDQGPQAGQGAGDRQLQYLFQRMPQYNNHVLHASFARIWTEIGQRDGICTHIAFRGPDREKVAVFSDRPAKLTGYRVIVHSRDEARYKPYLTSEGEIDLARLLAAPDLHGSYVAARLMPSVVSDALADKEQIKAEIVPMQTPVQILQTFAAGRLDFFLGLPIEADYYRDTPAGQEPRKNFPIKGVAKMVNFYTACSDAPLGRSVIRAIDRILRSDENWANFLAPYHDYFSAEDFAASLASKPERKEPP
jgi:uncharacterized protein (TIGR02285 family)